MTMLFIPGPELGLHTGEKSSVQPPLTSRNIFNAWPTNPTNGKRQISTRPGTSSYFSGYLGGSGNKVQAIHSLPYQARHVSYSPDPIPDELWAVSITGNPTISCTESGLFDDFYAIVNNSRLVHYSRYGIELGAIDLPNVISGAGGNLLSNGKMHVDPATGAIYVATSDWITDLSGIGGNLIWKFQLLPDNMGLELVWAVAPGLTCLVQGMHAAGESLWTLETFYTSTTTCEVKLVEYTNVNTADGPQSGDRAVRKTISAANIAALDALYPVGGPAVFGHDMDMRTVGETCWVIAVGSIHTAGIGVWAQLKIAGGTYAISAPYCFVNDEASAATANRGGGIGFAVTIDVTGNAYSIGRRNPNDRNAALAATSGNWLRKLVDTGTAWSETQGWVRTTTTDIGGAANNPGYSYPCVALDKFANFIAPTCFSDIAVDAAKVVKNDGTLFTSIRHREDVTTPPTINNTNNDCRAVAVPTTHPEYQPDDYKITDTVFVAGSNVVTLTSEPAGASIHGYDILLETPSPVSSRAVARLGVAAGGIYRFTTGGTQVPTNSTGRDPVLNANARFVQCADAKGEVFFTDGQNYAVYRPMPGDATNPNGEIVEWRASSLGIIPPRARLICRWRGRIVLAHTADSPYAWHMSAFDDPYNWDLDPPEVLETQAVSGQSLPAIGSIPDLIHALIPWSDALLFVGGARSIQRFDDDPMSGGRLSVVSEKIGMAFGTPWCKDPEGRIYFFGSSGGIYVMSASGELAWLTRDTIEADLSDIDFSTNRVELTWNSRDNGLHVWVMPYGSGGVHVRHYFWSQRTGGWFPIEMGTSAYTLIQPTAVHTIDGDTAIERVMLIGTEDGRVLKWDPDSALDANQPIYRKVLIGPLAGPAGDFEARWKRPVVVLASDLGGCNVKLLASNTPETPVMPRSGIRVGPGRNQRLPIGARGSWCWLELSSASRVGASALSEMWALESITIEAIVAGRVHARA